MIRPRVRLIGSGVPPDLFGAWLGLAYSQHRRLRRRMAFVHNAALPVIKYQFDALDARFKIVVRRMGLDEIQIEALGSAPDPVVGTQFIYALSGGGTSNLTLSCLNSLDLSRLFGPLVLGASSVSPSGMDSDDAAETFVINWGEDELAAYDSAGDELWQVDPGVVGVYGFGVGYAGSHVINSLRSTTTNTNDTLSLEVRNPSTGGVLSTEEVLVNTDVAVADSVQCQGLVTRKNASNTWQVFMLVFKTVSTGPTLRDVILYSYNLSGSSLTLDDSRTLLSATNVSTTDHHEFLARAPAHVYAGFFDVSETNLSSMEALVPSTLADDDANDYTNQEPRAFPTAIANDAPSDLTTYYFEAATPGSVVTKYDLAGTLQETSPSVGTGVDFLQARTITKSDAIALTAVADIIRDDTAYSQQMVATGSPDTWQLHALPAGMTISATGLVEWATPVVSGSPHTVRVYARGAAGWDSEEWTVTIVAVAPVINAIADDNHTQYFPYSKTPTLSAGDSPITWSLDTSPSGATINSSTGVISWTDTLVPGDYNWVVRATNAKGFDTEDWTTTVDPL